MKLNLFSLAALVLIAACLSSCSKKDPVTAADQAISSEVKAKITALGFDPVDAKVSENGYIVEGDIFLTDEDLNKPAEINTLGVANGEQYHTTNLVNGMPRNITVWIKTGNGGQNLPVSYGAGLDEAIIRYNAENLLVSFTRVYTSAANIDIVKGNGSYLASAGFPSGGNPFGSIKVNSGALGNSPGTNYLATILAHEIGHCIGMRHTDYADRSFSCGGGYANEGASTVGAIYIPGTAVGPYDDATSWMLACISSGQNRPFNANDKTALNYLY